MKHKKILLIFTLSLIVIVLVFVFSQKFVNKISEEDFKAPGKSWSSPKKVADYFSEKLRFTPADFENQKNRTTVDFRLYDGSTLEAVVGNLQYYGFIRSKKALLYALKNTEDKTPGHEGVIKVEKNGSIDIYASYRISENMSAWEIADTLLNKPTYFGKGDPYNYMFMP